MAASLSYTYTPATFDFDLKIIVEATRGLSAGRAQPRPSAWKTLGVFLAVFNPNDVINAYTTHWGKPRQGTTIHLRITLINAAGLRSNSVEATCVVS